MRPTGQQLVDWFMQLRGKPYLLGTEQDGKSVDEIAKIDCSEGVQNCCDQNGVVPRMPDGARYQQAHCRNHSLEISLEDAYATPGALFFSGDPAHHVAMSRGVKGKADSHRRDDREHWLTIEARGKNYGVGCWEADRPSLDSAALIPGVYYGPEWED
jgi:hypothetical protein